jgi:hypothetical protein
MVMKVNEGGRCGEIGPLIELHADGRLDELRGREVRSHLLECEPCRRRAVEALDATAIFLEMRSKPLPEAHWAGFTEGVRARIDAERASAARGHGWTVRFDWATLLRRPRLTYVAAPLMMLLLLAVSLFVLQGDGQDRVAKLSRQGAMRSPYDSPITPPRSHRAIRPTGSQLKSVALAPASLEQADPPALEEVLSAGARVYRFSVGAPGDETPVFMVIDESIEF